MTRETMEFDVVIVGAGPAGLSAAIRLKQLANETKQEISVCILEKGSEVGAHILSGAVFETRALDELLPNWQELDAPLHTPASKDYFCFLTKNKAWRLPTPPQMHNKGNYIISLGNLCRWLAQQAEALGVEIYPGFAASEIIYDEHDKVIGVATGDMGLTRDANKGPNWQPGINLLAKTTIISEGCRGSLAQQLMQKFDLRKNCDPQTFAIGLKELWEIDPNQSKPGTIWHSTGWPLKSDVYGGSFVYHLNNNQLAIGFVVGLDYQNPYLSPYQEFQQFKHHPKIASLLTNGRRIAYGARALNEGGFQSIPKVVFPGGLIIGCSAGFLNVPKIKGSHTAMKSGMLAAETIVEHFNAATPLTSGMELSSYEDKLKQSWIYEELHKARNIRPAFKWGFWSGLIYAALDTLLLRGKAPWTLKHHGNDHDALKKKHQFNPIEYPKADGNISFERLTNLAFSGTNHEENQPCHLVLKDSEVPISHNLEHFDAPEQRYCPAGVYEIIQNGENEKPQLQINAQNCVHCKTCDIKDPLQNIQWRVPEGGGGPNYPNM